MTNLFALLCQYYSSHIQAREALAQQTLVSLVSTKALRLWRSKHKDSRSRSDGALAAKLFLRESLTIRVLYTLSLLAGLTALLAGCSSNRASNSQANIPAVSVESLSNEEIENYAKAVLAIEDSRQNAYNEIQQINNDEPVPDINCTQPETINVLSGDIKKIAVNYCNQSKKFISETQGLTMARFNGITVSAQEDLDLQRRIQNELIRLQKQS
jgi:hypothetical protein